MSRDSVARGMAGAANGRVTRRRGKDVAPSQNGRLRYIHIGDSIVQGDGDARANSFATRDLTFQTAISSNGYLLPIRNGGVGGQTSPMIAARVLRDVIKFGDIDVIGVTCGTNDITILTSDTYIEQSLSAIHETVKSTGKYLFFTTIPPYAANKALTTSINNKIKAFCASVGRRCVDIYAALEDPGAPGEFRANYSFDAIHPTSRTTARLGALIWSEIKGDLPLDALQYSARAYDAASLGFQAITTAGAASSGSSADFLLKNYRSFTQNGFTLDVPRIWGTQYPESTAPTMTATVGPKSGFVGNAWTLTATSNGVGYYSADTSPGSRTINLTRFQGRRLRVSWMFETSGFDVDNTDAYLAANNNAPMSVCGLMVQCRNSANQVINNGSIVDPIDSAASLGQASSIGFNYQSRPLSRASSGNSWCLDVGPTPICVEINVPAGAVEMSLLVKMGFAAAGATNPISMSIGDFYIEDLGPAVMPQLPVSNPVRGFLKVSSAYTITEAEALSIPVWLCNATSGAFALTLPAASLLAGREIVIKKTDSSANAVTVTRAGSDTINNAAATTVALTTQDQIVRLVSTGTVWDQV